MANEIIYFNAPELRDWLETKDDITEDILDTLETNRVNGRTLIELTENDLKELFPILGDRKAVQRVIDSLKPQPKVHQVAPHQHHSVNDSCSFKIPDRFSRATMERLEKGEITDALRCEVVTSICVPWYQDCAYPSKEEYTAVSKQLVQKYPVLKDSYGNGYGSWKQQIRRKFKNLRAPPKTVNRKRSREEDTENEQPQPPLNTPSKRKSYIAVTAEEEEEYDIRVQLLQEECAKEKPKKSKLIAEMESTVAKRRQWIHDESPSVADILEKFPPLTLGIKYMQNELAAATNGDLHDEKQAREAWDNFLVKLFRKVEIEGGRSKLGEIRKQQQEEETIYTDEFSGRQLRQLYGLKYLVFMLAPRAKCSLLHRFDSPSNIAEQAKKVPINHPYIGVVAGDDSLSFNVVTERLLILSTGSFFKAFQALMASFYAFNIEYPKALSAPLTFMQHFIFSIKEESLPPAIVRFISSVDKLDV